MGSKKPGPCPFCGVSNTCIESGLLDGRYSEEKWFQVQCQECCAVGSSRSAECDAVEAWNNAGSARAEAAETQMKQLRAELERTKMAMATAYTDLPVWSESALAHLSPAERAADEVRAALGRFMQAEVDRRKGAAEAQADKEVSDG